MQDWEKLLNEDRFRTSKKSENDLRTEFERDHDRIIYTSAFRRLQDKAQVFPLERQDFVRTRLTHSLEVSTLARSLGVNTARKLKNVGVNDPAGSFGSILSSAALIHDLGNPPFGHFGEDSIGIWFDKWFKENGVHSLTEDQKKEFTDFESNAQTFRIITKLQTLNDQDGGLNLTYGTLASLFKYPRSSAEVRMYDGASFKKYGYFESEKKMFDTVAKEAGLDGHRHPLAFLLEAADDIAYSAGDLEDGFKKGVLTWEDLLSILETKLQNDNDKQLIEVLKKRKNRYDAVQLFRIAVQGKMLTDTVKIFVDNIDSIMNGVFDKNLLECSESADLHKVLKNEIGLKKVYASEEVVEQEIVSSKVIDGLLDMFVETLMSEKYQDLKTKEGKLYSLISPNFRNIFEKTDNSPYHKLRLVTDYISGMTDSYALALYQKFWGYRI